MVAYSRASDAYPHSILLLPSSELRLVGLRTEVFKDLVPVALFARNSCLFLAGQYPSEFHVACCVVGLCK